MTKLFFHYKNKPYKYLGTAKHSETLEELALYETLYDNPLGRIWVRPKEMFFEKVVIDGRMRPRFEAVEVEVESYEQLGEHELGLIGDLHKELFGSNLREIAGPALAKYKKWHVLVARIRNQVVGYKMGSARGDDLFLSWYGGVAPAWRKLGVASLLMKKQHQWCARAGFKTIETRTRNNNGEMLRLNIRHGFSVTGTDLDEDMLKVILRKNLD